eukprot:5504888-Lingulodinium_polyedra.AAC.1
MCDQTRTARPPGITVANPKTQREKCATSPSAWTKRWRARGRPRQRWRASGAERNGAPEA